MIKIISISILLIFNLYAKNNTDIPILLDNSDYKIYVKPDGKLAFLGCYSDALKFNSNGLAPVSLEGDTWIFINDIGQKINKKTFDSIDEFAKNGLAAASKNGQYGYIDIYGNWIIKPKFDEAYKFDTVENNLSLAMAYNGEECYGYKLMIKVDNQFKTLFNFDDRACYFTDKFWKDDNNFYFSIKIEEEKGNSWKYYHVKIK